jgi:hypothetical protein
MQTDLSRAHLASSSQASLVRDPVPSDFSNVDFVGSASLAFDVRIVSQLT